MRGQCLSDIQKELIRSCMRHMVFLELEIEQLDKRIAELIQASQQQVPCQLLQTIPGCRAPEFLGRGLPRQPRERRQAQEPAHHARQPVVPRHADRVRLGRLAQEGKRLAGPYQRLKPRMGHKRARSRWPTRWCKPSTLRWLLERPIASPSRRC